MNPILKAIINLIKSVISKFAYNRKISNLEKEAEKVKEEIKGIKEKKAEIKETIKESKNKINDIKNAQKKSVSVDDTEKYIKDFIKRRQ